MPAAIGLALLLSSVLETRDLEKVPRGLYSSYPFVGSALIHLSSGPVSC